MFHMEKKHNRFISHGLNLFSKVLMCRLLESMLTTFSDETINLFNFYDITDILSGIWLRLAITSKSKYSLVLLQH